MSSKLRSTTFLALALLGLLLAVPSQAQPACITFDPLLLGTVYGAPAGQSSGDLAFTLSGIRVHVVNFHRLPAGFSFNRAHIDIAPAGFGPGQSIRTNNIGLLFDFRALGFNVKKVTFSYLDLGGYENLSVNAAGVYVGELSAAPAVLGGANVTVTSSPVPGGKTGTVTVKASTLQALMVGGQELWIDSVCAS
jgi:hypothetical protein